MYAQNRKFGKASSLKVFVSNKTKMPNLDNHIRLRSPIPEGR